MSESSPTSITETREPSSRVILRLGRDVLNSTLGAPETAVDNSFQISRSRSISGYEGVKMAGSFDRAKLRNNLTGNGTSISALVRRHGFKRTLGGQIPELMGGYSFQPDGLADRKYDVARHGKIPFQNGFSKAWETGVNVGELVKSQPDDRFKFYLSLDLSDDSKKARANQFMNTVHAKAAESGIAMLTKTEDHAYDSCDLYTWSPETMSGILRETYQDFPDIWLSVDHPLQGEVGGIDPQHIGFVQEPIGGLDGDSHSTRMGKLGASLDAHLSPGTAISDELWQQVCGEVGVVPEAPWMIAS